MSLPKHLILLIFVHGFKGTDSTFAKFPERLEHLLRETIEDIDVRSVLFPAYETTGELDAAVERFTDWLVTLVVEEESFRVNGESKKAKIVLCGHSMGGLVTVDSLLNLLGSSLDANKLRWPDIIACISFDTPYLGLHPFVFKNSATEVYNRAQSAHKAISSLGFFPSSAKAESLSAANNLKLNTSDSVSSWSKWAPTAYGVGSALITGAIAGSAYYRRNDVGTGLAWITDHLKYIGTLWNEQALVKRMDNIAEAERRFGLVFYNFYTLLPPKSIGEEMPRTFIIVPQSELTLYSRFWEAKNGIASNEIEAHIGMFSANTNDGYYELGLATAEVIRKAVWNAPNMIL